MMGILVLLILLILPLNSALAQNNFDSPDTQFESEMYDINKTYNSEPLPDSEWLNMVGSRRSETYKIQRGDTLWDISRTFFGDGKFWPKLWSENSNIQNPHEILPRKKIQFFAGTVAEAPSFNIVDEDKVAPSAPTYVLLDDQDQEIIDPNEPRVINGKPVIPKPSERSHPVLQNLPPSFKSPVPLVYGDYDKSGLDASALAHRNYNKTSQLVPFIVMQDEPQSVGKVTEMQTGGVFGGTGQSVFVKMDQGAEAGQQFTTFFDAGKLSNDEISRGRIMQVGGRIEIREAVDASKNVYRARVIESVNPIHIGSLVTTLKLPSVNFAIDKGISSARSTVVGGEYDRARKLVGLGSVVYLRSEGQLNVGEVLAIDSIRKNRIHQTKYPSAEEAVAVAKVVNVDGDLSTAVIIQSVNEVSIGDVTGGPVPENEPPEVHPRQPVEITNSTIK